MADCGACGFCCRVLAVPDIQKPALMTCEHVGLHGGCAVQHTKLTDPKMAACAAFKCLWLDSQDHENEEWRMGRHLRPDISHVMFGPPDRENDKKLFVHVDSRHPTAWKDEEIMDYLREIVKKGGTIEIVVGERHFPFEGNLPEFKKPMPEFAVPETEFEIIA